MAIETENLDTDFDDDDLDDIEVDFEDDDPEEDEVDEGEGSEGGATLRGEEEGEEDPRVEIQKLRQQATGMGEWARRQRLRNEQLEEANKKLSERQDRILKALAESAGIDPREIDPNAPEPAPDPEVDPPGYIIATVRDEMKQLREELAGKQEEQQRQKEVEGAIQEIREYHDRDAERFTKEHPDYEEAQSFLLGHMFNGTLEALRFQHPGATEEELRQEAGKQTLQAVANLQVAYHRAGRSLVQESYQRAVAMGFEPGASEPRGPAATLKAKRKKAGSKLSGAGRSTPITKPGVEALLDMSDDDFDRVLEEKGFDELAKVLAT